MENGIFFCKGDKKMSVADYVNGFAETYGLTVLVFCLSAVCIGVIVELFKQTAFAKLEKRYEDEGKDASKLKTFKSVASFLIAAALVALFLASIHNSTLPTIGGIAVVPIWYTVMFLLQLFVDIKGVKSFIGRVLGNIAAPPKMEKPAKRKVIRKVVYEDENGNPVDGNGNPLEVC